MSDLDFDKLTNELREELKDYPHTLKVINGTITKNGVQENVEQTTEQVSLDKIQYESLASVPK